MSRKDLGVEEPDADQMVSLEEAAQILGVSKPTVYRWLDEGKIRGFKAGRQWRFYVRDVREVLQDAGEAEAALRGLGGLRGQLESGIAREEKEELEKFEAEGEAGTTEQAALALVHQVLIRAVRQDVLDILFEPMHERMRIRFRNVAGWRVVVDGKVPGSTIVALTRSIKRLGGMSLAHTRSAQDGRCLLTLFDREIDFRVNLIPSLFGEGVCMRVLDKERAVPALDRIGLHAGDLARLRAVMEGAEGILLAVGATGSGKTTLLYSILQELNSPERNIVTVENPVEYTFPGMIQAQVRIKDGYTFAAAMRGVLRHAPDVVMVGEIRDSETLGIMCEASMTGRLCLSALHVPDPVAAVTRLRNIGVADFLIADCLRVVLAPKVVGTICSSCAGPHQPAKEVFDRLGIPPSKGYRRGAGCDACHGTGFSGARQICGVLVVDDLFRERVRDGADEKELGEIAGTAGMRTLREEGLRAAAEGITTLEEVARVLK